MRDSLRVNHFIRKGIKLSFTKKLAAVVSAAAIIVTGVVSAAPANAKSFDALVTDNIMASVKRTVDPTTHQATFFAGEQASFSYSATLKPSALAQITSSTPVVISSGFSVVSGPTPAFISSFGSSTATLNGTTDRGEMMTPATSFSKTYASTPTALNFNINANAALTAESVIAFNPTVTIGGVALTADDLNIGYTSASAYIGGMQMDGSNIPVTSVTARAVDSQLNFQAPRVCIDTTSLAVGDVLEGSFTVSDGTANVGNFNPMWSVRNAQGMMQGGMGSQSTWTVTDAALVSGNKAGITGNLIISAPVAGTTYTFTGFKVNKQGQTANLITSCGTTAATATTTATGTTVNVVINTTADAAVMYESYVCNLYASADTAHATVVKSGSAWLFGPNGPMANPTCEIPNVPAGTYTVALIGQSYMAGVGSEKFLDGTVTVSGSVTPAAKKAPKVPTVVTKLKIGKSATVVLHATKGTASKGANVDGLATVVSVAAASKAYCSVTKTVKSGKINGYAIKGLKAGKCSVVVTITGNATYNALTKTIVVTVSK